MKFKRIVAMSVAALAGCIFAAEDNTPGFVKVEWSLKTGETWEVKGLADREAAQLEHLQEGGGPGSLGKELWGPG